MITRRFLNSVCDAYKYLNGIVGYGKKPPVPSSYIIAIAVKNVDCYDNKQIQKTGRNHVYRYLPQKALIATCRAVSGYSDLSRCLWTFYPSLFTAFC